MLSESRTTAGRNRPAFAWNVRFCGAVCALALFPAPGWTETADGPIPSGRYLLVSSARCHPNDFDCQIVNAVLRYNAMAGPNFGKFDGVHVADIDDPQDMAIHPTRGTLMVVSRGDNAVYECNRHTGALLGTYIIAGAEGLHRPQSIVFLPNGNAAVSSIPDQVNPNKVNGIIEFDGNDGSFVRYFVNGGNLLACTGNVPPTYPPGLCVQGVARMILGNNGNLFFASSLNNRVIECDSTTAAYVGHFAAGKLVAPNGLAIRPPGTPNAGNLLVTSLYTAGGADVTHKIVEFNGITRLLVSTNVGVFYNGLENPGPLHWESNTVLLACDRLHWRMQGSNYSDRIRRLNAATGVPCSMATCDPDPPEPPENPNYYTWISAGAQKPLHFCTGMLMADIGCDSTADCSDDNVCTDDLCDVGTHTCTNPPNDTVDPSDGIYCNGVEDPCANGQIAYSSPPPNCDDDIPCTADQCLEGPASYVCQNTLPADQCLVGNDCTEAGTVNPANACQECNPTVSTSGWTNSVSGTPCGDQINNDCNRPNTCDGAGSCNENLVADGTSCSNDTLCDGEEMCAAGLCVAGPPPHCDDGVFCNGVESCDPSLGCLPGEDPCPLDLVCDEEANQCAQPRIPTVSQWGLMVLALTLMVAAKIGFRVRSQP